MIISKCDIFSHLFSYLIKAISLLRSAPAIELILLNSVSTQERRPENLGITMDLVLAGPFVWSVCFIAGDSITGGWVETVPGLAGGAADTFWARGNTSLTALHKAAICPFKGGVRASSQWIPDR